MWYFLIIYMLFYENGKFLKYLFYKIYKIVFSKIDFLKHYEILDYPLLTSDDLNKTEVNLKFYAYNRFDKCLIINLII